MPGLAQVRVAPLLLEALVHAAAMAKATTMVAGEEQDSWAATSDAADPEQLWTVHVQGALKVVVVVFEAMGVLLLL